MPLYVCAILLLVYSYARSVFSRDIHPPLGGVAAVSRASRLESSSHHHRPYNTRHLKARAPAARKPSQSYTRRTAPRTVTAYDTTPHGGQSDAERVPSRRRTRHGQSSCEMLVRHFHISPYYISWLSFCLLAINSNSGYKTRRHSRSRRRMC